MQDPLIKKSIVILMAMGILYFALHIVALFGAIFAGLMIGSVITFMFVTKKGPLEGPSNDITELREQLKRHSR